MSDFSKLTVDGTTYNVKDATARNNYESANASITEINTKLNKFSINYADETETITITTLNN